MLKHLNKCNNVCGKNVSLTPDFIEKFFYLLTLKLKIMKKILVMALAVVAISFASCGNKAQQKVEEVADSTEAVVEDVNAAAEEAISALSEQIEKKDAGALQTALEAIKAKVASFIAANPELAKEYLGKVQGFLKENADKIKAVVGDNAAINSLVAGITALPTESVDALMGAGDALKALGIDATAKAADAVEGAKDAVEGAADAAADAVKDAKDAAVDKANEAVDNAKEKAGEAIDNAAADAKKKLGL